MTLRLSHTIPYTYVVHYVHACLTTSWYMAKSLQLAYHEACKNVIWHEVLYQVKYSVVIAD